MDATGNGMWDGGMGDGMMGMNGMNAMNAMNGMNNMGGMGSMRMGMNSSMMGMGMGQWNGDGFEGGFAG